MPGVSNFCRIHWHCSRSLMNMNSTPMCWQYAICSNGKYGAHQTTARASAPQTPKGLAFAAPTGSQGQEFFISPFTLSAKEPLLYQQRHRPSCLAAGGGSWREPSCQTCNSPALGALFELYSQGKGCGRACSRMLQGSLDCIHNPASSCLIPIP